MSVWNTQGSSFCNWFEAPCNSLTPLLPRCLPCHKHSPFLGGDPRGFYLFLKQRLSQRGKWWVSKANWKPARNQQLWGAGGEGGRTQTQVRPDGFVFAPVNTLAEKLFCAVKLASFGLFPRVSNPFPDSIWGEREREREQVNWGGGFPPIPHYFQSGSVQLSHCCSCCFHSCIKGEVFQVEKHWQFVTKEFEAETRITGFRSYLFSSSVFLGKSVDSGQVATVCGMLSVHYLKVCFHQNVLTTVKQKMEYMLVLKERAYCSNNGRYTWSWMPAWVSLK